MPVSNFTAKLLEMEDAIIEDLHTTNSEVHIFFSLKKENRILAPTAIQLLIKYTIMSKKTFLHYRKRRYHCPCCNKHFYESFRLLPKHCRITTRLAFYSIHLLRDRQSIRAVAELLGISDSSVFRRMQDVRFPKPSHLPKVSFEFRGNAGGFQSSRMPKAKHILPSKVSLMQYLQDFPNKKEVRYFVTDMNKICRDLASEYFPNATIVVDKFHVIRYVTWALENVRKRFRTET